MRLFAAAVALFLFLVAPALAAGPVFDTPKALLQYAYQPYSTGDFKDDNDVLYTKQLNDMFAAADLMVLNKSDLLTDLTIGDPVPDGAGVKVPVSLKNFGDPQSLVFYMVKEGGGWKINDIESLTPSSTWRLTTMLTPDPANSSTGAAPSN